MKPNRNLLVITAVIVLAVMTAIALYLTRQNQSGNVVGREVQSVESVAGQAAPAPDGSITAADVIIPPEMLKRIGLKSEPAGMSSFNEQLRTAGMVQPSAYRETRINPLVGGRVTEVKAQLGDYVKEGQIIARIFSSELAEAQMQYLTVFANLDFHIKQDRRYESLANLGAISKQEQEEVHAKLLEHHAEHAALREKMKLYGLTDGEINAH
ncbi:MAG: efflux RND transporter periplasmic adaptor subunit [Acidobacteria bacterium]|nr:efflux RND transporter periplasmic adaptor subunit [Acidobacteriota bacterium]